MAKFGEHLTYDAYGCSYQALSNMELCFDVLNDLVKLAKMRKLTEPVIIKADGNTTLGGKDPGGFSGFVIIEESHISIHTFAKRGFITLDVYSCKPFEEGKIVEYLNKTFEAKDFDVTKTSRGLKYPNENIY
ncbi:MAG: adenosylmethionine decarboxylase [candidate division WWE3 bacterium]|nr:adenosylmethionine decarboxylase [candidate division WWE3 bacterium]